MSCAGQNKKGSTCSVEVLAAAKLNFRTGYFNLLRQVYIDKCKQGRLIFYSVTDRSPSVKMHITLRIHVLYL